MLRSAFRSRTSKDPKDEPPTSSDRVLYNIDDKDFVELSKDLNDRDDHLFVDAEDSLSASLNTEKSPEDPNGNLLVKSKIYNPSLDNELYNEDQANFPYTERQIYEMQLVQLQEQLVATIIQEQEKSEKLKQFEEINIEKLLKDLKDEQEKNVDLTERMKVLKNKAQNQKITRANASRSDPRRRGNRSSKNFDTDSIHGEDWVDLSTDMNEANTQDYKPESDRSSSIEQSPPHPEKQSSTESITSTDGLTQPVRDNPDCSDKPSHKQSRIGSYKRKFIEMIVDRLWDFVNEEPESSSEDNVDDNGDTLAVKTLKENINRFTNGIKPITHFIKSVNKVVRWSNPAASLISFIVYMYSARHGFLFSLLLMLVIWKLLMNYLHARGYASQIGLAEIEKDETPDDKSWSDKFQLVLQVARKVQNMLGRMADSLEKIKNLLTWQHPATKSLFAYLCIAFVASIVLSGPTLFMFMALGFGIKMFITGPIYAKFPKVKQRYDGVARIWSELPTQADLATKEINDNEILSASTSNNTADGHVFHSSPHQSSSVQCSQNWANFCERFRIPVSETPLPIWEEGRRCTLMNKDKPLTNMKNGRLFLTQSYLCFERNKTGSSKNVAIRLKNIAHVSKSKPIGLMPGSGMAIEVEVKGTDKPYIFGALLGRDELFESLIMTGRAADFEWAK